VHLEERLSDKEQSLEGMIEVDGDFDIDREMRWLESRFDEITCSSGHYLWKVNMGGRSQMRMRVMQVS